MNVRLTPQLTEFVKDQVEAGRYLCASEVVREALRMLADEQARRAAPAQVVREDSERRDAEPRGRLAEERFAALRDSDRESASGAAATTGALDDILLDCLAAISSSTDGARRLARIRDEFKRRAKQGKVGPESDARVRIALAIVDVAKTTGRVRTSGDESALGVPISAERWERIFGSKAP